MQKTFKLFLAFIVALFTLPVFGSSAFAAEADVEYQDGEYNIIAKALHADKDERSGAAGFINEEATLSIQDGNYELTITIPDNDIAEIKGIQIEGIEPIVEEGDSEKRMTFSLSGLKSELQADVQYIVPSMDKDHDVPFRFILEGLDDIPVKEETEEGSEDSTEQDDSASEDANSEETDSEEGSNSEESNPSVINLNDGHYTINASYLKADSDDTSSMGSYLNDSVFLTVKDGKVNATITINEDETVTKLQVDGKEAVEQVVDGEKRYETFELNQLDSLLNAYVEYQAPFQGSIFEGNADFRISFDEGSVAEAQSSDKPGADIEQNEEKESDSSEGKEESNQNQNNDSEKTDENNNKSETPKKSNQLVPDKAYEIDYIVKHETEDKASAADNFFEKPGILLEKDGAYYLQVTVTSSDMIDSLETEFGPAIIVEDNGDSKVVQIRVNDDLSKATILDMHITVPGMYSMNHSARVYLDESSMKEVDVDNYELVAGTEENLNGPLVEGADPGNALDDDGNKDGNTNDGTPNKPDFGDNDDNGTTPGQDDGKGKNPQTGDTSGILLYTLLLIGSMIPLAVKLKRRFV
ncbi:MAG TPA: NEAT domain-containing protein [Candidatus Avamphibacillus sp.]|nr:NEAT domain-containing protein [Candidatus Avamphibacillus sp.]